MKKFRELSEAIKDKYDIGEYDQEGDMAKSDLRSIIANSKRVHDMLKDDDNLPEWVQSKITKAEDYMSTVANYLESEMNEEAGASKKKEEKFHMNLDKLVHKTFGKRKEEMKEAKETGFQKTFRKNTGETYDQYTNRRAKEEDERQEQMKKQKEDYIKQGIIKAESVELEESKLTLDNVLSKGEQINDRIKKHIDAADFHKAQARKVDAKDPNDIEGYNRHASLTDLHMKASWSLRNQKKSPNGNHLKDYIATHKRIQDRYKKDPKLTKEEVDESIASTVGGLVGQYAGSKIGMEGPGKEHGALAGRMIDYHARKFLKKVKNKITGQKNESVELDEGKYGGFRVGPKRPRYPYVPQGDSDPRTGLPLGFSNPPKSEKPEDKKMKKEEVETLEEKNVPTSPEKWSRAKAMAKQKFDVYPSAYANGWAAKKYKEMGGGWKSVSEETDLEEGYFKSQETERQETERLAKRNEPPFTPDKPKKKSVVVGKKPEGYSRARQLARQAMQKYTTPVKEEKDMSKKAKVVKDIIKKSSDDKFQAKPELSNSVTRNL
jgi:hypothetical protein